MTRILIVEDNELNRDMLGRRLQRRGFDIIFAADVTTAVTMARMEEPSLILMDIGLGAESGLDATRQIRGYETDHHVPIIALTAHAMMSDRDQCLAAGCDEFETKPVEFERLMRKIEKHLGTEDVMA